jgi:hypothetical protein
VQSFTHLHPSRLSAHYPFFLFVLSRNVSFKRVFDSPGRHPEASPGTLLEAAMKLPALSFGTFVNKATFAALALGGFLLFAGAPGAKANSWDDGNRRVAYTEWRYNEAVEHFGPYSRQARHWAHERSEACERRVHLREERREIHRDHDGDYRGWDRH